MKKVFKVATAALISAALISAAMTGGCTAYTPNDDVSLLMDYESEAIFTSENGSQFIVAEHRNDIENKLKVCYQDDGVYGFEAERTLREVANEWLEKNHETPFVAVEGRERTGVWEARTCYEFHYEQKMSPIGAYLDEETGEVVIVGEHIQEP
ncbi:hypothetical protein [Vibrio jasicida]|uniref:hypothetical protein n=1 Tax=Vibrio jasicida TaxID=766224 RepID=UPI000CE532AF|nr:hypothetical protein [Vibrio jasicida]